MERSSVKLLVLSIRTDKNRAIAAGYQCNQPWCYYRSLPLQWLCSELLETMGWIAAEHQESRIRNSTGSRTRVNLLEKDSKDNKRVAAGSKPMSYQHCKVPAQISVDVGKDPTSCHHPV